MNKDHTKIRRIDNAPLPAKSGDGTKKRDSKAKSKEESKTQIGESKEESSDVEIDERGYPVFVNQDFENP